MSGMSNGFVDGKTCIEGNISKMSKRAGEAIRCTVHIGHFYLLVCCSILYMIVDSNRRLTGLKSVTSWKQLEYKACLHGVKRFMHISSVSISILSKGFSITLHLTLKLPIHLCINTWILYTFLLCSILCLMRLLFAVCLLH